MEEIGLQELIYQVKHELLARNPAQQAKDPYPLFFIDGIELEIAVKVSRGNDGQAKITVMGFAEIGGGKSQSQEKGHIIRVTLSPLLPREMILADVLKDDRTRQVIQNDLAHALVKGDAGMVGEPE